MGQVKKRQTDFDIFRGAGIILMVMGHIGFSGIFDHFIHAFHMPMFFFISGFFFKSSTVSKCSTMGYIIKKLKTLLIPYIVFAIFHSVIWIIMGNDLKKPLNFLWINSDDLPISGALWFLTALFLADLFYFLIDRYICREVWKHCIVVLLCAFGNLYSLFLPIALPFSLGAALVGLGLFHIGRYAKKYCDSKVINRSFKLPIPLLILLTVVTVALIFINGYVNMRSETYAIIPLFWINAILAIVLGINYSKIFDTVLDDNNVIKKWIVDIGKNSIVYVCLNQVVIMGSRWLVNSIIPSEVYWLVRSLVVFVITFGVLFLLTLMLTKTKLKVLLGRF